MPASGAVVGRERELETLIVWWRAAEDHGLRWIEVCGETGIGKTSLVREAADRLGDARILRVAPTPEAGRPFGLLRGLVFQVLREVAGPEARPDRRESFATALAPLGDELTPFLGALWYLAAPASAQVPPPHSDPHALRRLLERGAAMLLQCFGRAAPGRAFFLDEYDQADQASAGLLESLGAGPDGWPVRFVVASRGQPRAPGGVQSVIRLDRLTDEAADELLDGLLQGASLPAVVRQDVLSRAAGVPGHLEELVRALIDEGVLVPTRDGLACEATEAAVTLPSSVRAAMMARLDRLDAADRDLLNQCAVQGVQFDRAVAEAVRRQVGGPAPPLTGQLASLQQRRFLAHVAGSRWAFAHSLVRDVCYEALLPRARRVLHGLTGDALSELAGGAAAAPADLLAYHYERAERWGDAALAQIRAGERESALFLNEEAIRRYAQAIAAGQRAEPLAAGDRRLLVRAHAGTASVSLRVAAYDLAEDHARMMRRLAEHPADRVEADWLMARVWAHTGRQAEAEGLVRSSIAAARQEPEARELLAGALCDLADICQRTGRATEALAHLAECRAAVTSDASPVLLQADMLEGRIAHAQGRLEEAARLYRGAYRRARRLESWAERAHAANNLGNANRDLGEYSEAERHFGNALEIWSRMGDPEGIAGAHNNLGNLAMSRGDLQAARTHHERSLGLARQTGNVAGIALGLANLGMLAIELDDPPGALAHARGALEALAGSGHTVLRDLVRVVLGEALLAGGDLARARTEFETVARQATETEQRLAAAGAWRGLGRVSLAAGAHEAAVAWLSRALQAYRDLAKSHEANRTRLHLAQALWEIGEHERARTELSRARARLAAIGARSDVLRADRLLAGLAGPDAPSPGASGAA